MSDIFYASRPSNSFDNMFVDVKRIYEAHPFDNKEPSVENGLQRNQSLLHKIYGSQLLPLDFRERIWKLAHQTHLDLSWFEEFKQYWSTVLHGRPLWSAEDFYFLKNLYRVKFQNNQVPDTSDANLHLEAWQRPEILYLLLHYVFKQAIITQNAVIKEALKYGKPKSILEYGCSAAPITTSILDFSLLPKNTKFFIADIQTLPFHYACFRYRKASNIKPILLVAENDFQLSINECVDAIFCIEVYEHMNAPLATTKLFYETLNPGGLLVFNYIKGSGQGLDTIHGVKERDQVLDFISENFEILSGTIVKEQTTALVVAQKRKK